MDGMASCTEGCKFWTRARPLSEIIAAGGAEKWELDEALEVDFLGGAEKAFRRCTGNYDGAHTSPDERSRAEWDLLLGTMEVESAVSKEHARSASVSSLATERSWWALEPSAESKGEEDIEPDLDGGADDVIRYSPSAPPDRQLTDDGSDEGSSDDEPIVVSRALLESAKERQCAYIVDFPGDRHRPEGLVGTEDKEVAQFLRAAQARGIPHWICQGLRDGDLAEFGEASYIEEDCWEYIRSESYIEDVTSDDIIKAEISVANKTLKKLSRRDDPGFYPTVVEKKEGTRRKQAKEWEHEQRVRAAERGMPIIVRMGKSSSLYENLREGLFTREQVVMAIHKGRGHEHINKCIDRIIEFECYCLERREDPWRGRAPVQRW